MAIELIPSSPLQPMRIIFAGTPDFAAQALRALLEAGFDVPLVLTQPDRPAGRGMQLQPSAVKQLAVARGIPVFQPVSLKKDPSAIERLRATPHDMMVVAAYGLILPQAVLDIPRLGCINIHGSLLPRWRGAAPIQRAIEAGDAETGVCIMRMEAGLDTGPVYARKALPILPTDNATTLHDKLATLGAQMIVQFAQLAQSLAHLPACKPQPEAGITYAAKIEKVEAAIDWSQSADVIARKIRAFDPFPGCTFKHGDALYKAWNAHHSSFYDGSTSKRQIGEVLQADASGITVQCGSSAITLTQLQKPGGKRLAAREFLAGAPIAVGAMLA
jgi:methionyl-tRNA formyltransferase